MSEPTVTPKEGEGEMDISGETPSEPGPKTETAEKKGGVALIKPEYIDNNHVRRLVEKYLPADTVEEMKEQTSTGDGSEEPPAKKVKLKGRNVNKNRPREKRQQPSERPCPALLRGKECQFGERCKFIHDFKKYMETKPDDLGEACHLYRTYGYCHYGLACRYAKDHLTEDFKNKTNEDLFKKSQGVSMVSNIISKDLQRKLWKRQYNFKKAEKTYQRVKAELSAQKDKEKMATQSKIQSEEKNGADNLDTHDAAEKREQDLPVEKAAGSNVPGTESTDVHSAGLEKEKDVKIEPRECLITERNICQSGPVTESDIIKLRPEEIKKIDFSDKLYLAPLTTVGNLPFRRICKEFGVDITCGEMAMATNLLQGQQSEWALLKRHSSEDIFGVQVCGSYPDSMSRCVQLLSENTDVDFIDINCGCPIDMIYKRGEGCALMNRHSKFENVIKSMLPVMTVPLTVKIRTGIMEDKNIAHQLAPKLRDWGVSLVTLHGRSREQRYTRLANWDYIDECARLAQPMPLFGNGDILSYEDANERREQTGVSGLMVARGALIKPWVFTEIKDQRHWDISSSERFEMLRRYTNAGLEHWGSDQQGVSNTRRFLLEWLSFLYRYIPVGILERVPQKINEKPPYYFCRDDLETLMASSNSADWVKISEMLLGPVPDDFTFLPKHRANSYS